MVPVVDGFVASAAVRSLPIGGKDFAHKLRELLQQQRGVEITEAEARYVFEKCGAVQASPPGDAAAGEPAAPTSSNINETVMLDGHEPFELASERFDCTASLFQTRSYAPDGSGASLPRAVHAAVLCCADHYDRRDRKEPASVEKDLKVTEAGVTSSAHVKR